MRHRRQVSCFFSLAYQWYQWPSIVEVSGQSTCASVSEARKKPKFVEDEEDEQEFGEEDGEDDAEAEDGEDDAGEDGTDEDVDTGMLAGDGEEVDTGMAGHRTLEDASEEFLPVDGDEALEDASEEFSEQDGEAGVEQDGGQEDAGQDGGQGDAERKIAPRGAGQDDPEKDASDDLALMLEASGSLVHDEDAQDDDGLMLRRMRMGKTTDVHKDGEDDGELQEPPKPPKAKIRHRKKNSVFSTDYDSMLPDLPVHEHYDRLRLQAVEPPLEEPNRSPNKRRKRGKKRRSPNKRRKRSTGYWSGEEAGGYGEEEGGYDEEAGGYGEETYVEEFRTEEGEEFPFAEAGGYWEGEEFVHVESPEEREDRELREFRESIKAPRRSRSRKERLSKKLFALSKMPFVHPSVVSRMDRELLESTENWAMSFYLLVAVVLGTLSY